MGHATLDYQPQWKTLLAKMMMGVVWTFMVPLWIVEGFLALCAALFATACAAWIVYYAITLLAALVERIFHLL